MSVLRKIQITAICVLYIIHVILPIKHLDVYNGICG